MATKIQVPTDLVDAGVVYEALVGIAILNAPFGNPVTPQPYPPNAAAYGQSEILITYAMQPENINEMLKIHGGDNFDEEIQDVVVNTLLPNLYAGIYDKTQAGPDLCFFAQNAINTILTGASL